MFLYKVSCSSPPTNDPKPLVSPLLEKVLLGIQEEMVKLFQFILLSLTSILVFLHFCLCSVNWSVTGLTVSNELYVEGASGPIRLKQIQWKT